MKEKIKSKKGKIVSEINILLEYLKVILGKIDQKLFKEKIIKLEETIEFDFYINMFYQIIYIIKKRMSSFLIDYLKIETTIPKKQKMEQLLEVTEEKYPKLAEAINKFDKNQKTKKYIKNRNNFTHSHFEKLYSKDIENNTFSNVALEKLINEIAMKNTSFNNSINDVQEINESIKIINELNAQTVNIIYPKYEELKEYYITLGRIILNIIVELDKISRKKSL